MKLFVVVSLVVAALALVDCKPAVNAWPIVSASRSLPAAMSAAGVLSAPLFGTASRSKDFREAQIVAPAPVLAHLPDDKDASSETTHNNPDSDPTVEEPAVQEIRNLESIRTVASQIGSCKAEANAKCEVVKKTDGIICSNSSAGVDCNTRKGVPCEDEAYDACIDFAQSSGVFCSIGGCAQFL